MNLCKPAGIFHLKGPTHIRCICSVEMNRTTTVRVSPDELEQLKEYRADKYDSGIPLGYVIGRLLDEVSNRE